MEHIEIGRIIGTHGLDGKVMIQINSSYVSQINKGSFVFINVAKDTPIPFQITNLTKTGNPLEKIVSLKRINNIEDAKAINGSVLSLHESQVTSSHKTIIKEKFIAYTIIDNTLGVIGSINEIIETPHQRLALVVYQDNEVMIPLVEDFIESIKHKEKEIIMSLPEGLLNI